MKRTGIGGYTLIELLVVMAILGILAAAILPLGEALLVAQKERELRQGLHDIRNAIDEYKRAVDMGIIEKNTNSGYPPSLQALVLGAPPQKGSSSSTTHYFLRQVPRDPFAPAAVSAEASWRLRSYASPPTHPAPGADVFDVYSSSNGIALDGSSYAKW